MIETKTEEALRTLAVWILFIGFCFVVEPTFKLITDLFR